MDVKTPITPIAPLPILPAQTPQTTPSGALPGAQLPHGDETIIQIAPVTSFQQADRFPSPLGDSVALQTSQRVATPAYAKTGYGGRPDVFNDIVMEASDPRRSGLLERTYQGIRFTSPAKNIILMEFANGMNIMKAMYAYEDMNKAILGSAPNVDSIPFAIPVFTPSTPLFDDDLRVIGTFTDSDLESALHASNSSLSIITELGRRYMQQRGSLARGLFLAYTLSDNSGGKVPYADYMLARACLLFVDRLVRDELRLGIEPKALRFHAAKVAAINEATLAAKRLKDKGDAHLSSVLTGDLGIAVDRIIFRSVAELMQELWPNKEESPDRESLPALLKILEPQAAYDDDAFKRFTEVSIKITRDRVTSNRWRDAIAYLESALRVNPSNLVLQTLFVKSLRRTGDAIAAIKIAEELMLKDPDSTKNHYLLHEYACALSMAGRHDEALGKLEEILQNVRSGAYEYIKEENLRRCEVSIMKSLAHSFKRASRFEEALKIFGQLDNKATANADIAEVYFIMARSGAYKGMRLGLLMNCLSFTRMSLDSSTEEMPSRSSARDVGIRCLAAIVAELKAQGREQDAEKYQEEMNLLMEAERSEVRTNRARQE